MSRWIDTTEKQILQYFQQTLTTVKIRMNLKNDEFIFSSNTEDVEVAKVHAWLKDCSWSKGIPLSIVKQMISNSFCVSAFNKDGQQIGFARAITDYCTFAYICDVFVDPICRGKGIARLMLGIILDVHNFKKFKYLSLISAPESHALYDSLSFKKLSRDVPHMEFSNLDVYKAKR